MVANNFSGSRNNSMTRLSLADLLSAISLRFSRVNEKNAISEPEANAEPKSSNAATQAATPAANDGIVRCTPADDCTAACTKAVKNISKTLT